MLHVDVAQNYSYWFLLNFDALCPVTIVDTWIEYNLYSLELPTLAETREQLRCQLTNRKWQLIVPLAS